MSLKSRIISLTAAFVASAVSSTLFAVTLGDVTLNSSLNERLDGFIPLAQFQEIDTTELKVTIGSQADFDLVNLERNPIVDSINFKLNIQSTAEGLLSFSSTDIITEPYVDLVLNVTWPTGSLMRQYTVLIDLPTFSDNVSVANPTPARSSNEGNIVIIEQGSTLWEIALNNSVESVSVHQMMLGIQQANPNAFINNNINGIRAGAVLRIPTREELLALNQSQAVEQVALQNQQYSSQLANQPLASNNRTSGVSSTYQGDELKVLTGENEGELDSSSTNIALLEDELALSEENVDRAQIENIELASRLTDLETEIEILQNIIALEDERIAQLQTELKRQADLATQALVEAQAAQEPVETSLMGTLSRIAKSTWALMVVLGCVAALLVVFLIRRSRKEYEDDDFDPSLVSDKDELSEDYEEDEMSVDIDDDDVVDVEEQPETEPELGNMTLDEQSQDKPQGVNIEDDDLDVSVFEDDSNTDNDIELDIEVVEQETDANDLLEDSSQVESLDFSIADEVSTNNNVEIEAEEDLEVLDFSVDSTQTANADEESMTNDHAKKEVDVESISMDIDGDNDDNYLDLDNIEIEKPLITDENDIKFEDEDNDIVQAITDDKNESSTKLDLAVAYESMGDIDGAREILEEVIVDGTEEQVSAANKLKEEWKDL